MSEQIQNGTATNGATGANGAQGSNGAAQALGAFGLVRQADIVSEMQGAYLDYAMSVIVARALPDVRDGLKPVHRRILYAMHHDLGLDHTKPHKKSARIVGEVLGKYHPHGDSAVYDAMVRMAQEFSLRYPLIDGQGNFGSVDGDNAAAMRYTEARLAEISQLMLTDLEKDTVDWHENFDNSLDEPNILPAALPNLLINGSSGIAVGMATNIPPHNLAEIVDALVFMLDNYERVDGITVEHLMQFVKGPDFPTGGILYRYREDKIEGNMDVIAQGYSVGRTRLVVQAKAHFEEMSRGRSRIVITELPYQTNKVALLERIAALVRDGKIEGISDLRDESDRTGMRVVIELNRSAEPKHVLAELFKLTPLQQTFGMQMLSLVDGQPRTLGLKRMLQYFIEHRREIIRRRSEFDLARARERAHIVEGLLRALDVLDEVISTIRRSQNAETARTNLMRNFNFTQVQAQAILDMQLRRLAALERRRLQEEFKELQKQIAYLEDLLANPGKMLGVIKDDLVAIKEKYGDARRTQIVDRTKGTLTTTDLLPDQPVWVSVGKNGELRRREMARLSASTLRQIGQHSEVELLAANTRDYLHLFTGDGRARRVSIHDIPQNGDPKHVAELTDLTRRDDVTAALALPRTLSGDTPGYLFLVTAQGAVKRVALGDFVAAAATDPTVMGIDAKDRLRFVFMTQGEDDGEVILVSAQGQSIRFRENEARSMGLAAGGVGGMKLKKGDQVIYAAPVDPQGELLTMTAQGFAKRTPLEQYSTQGRNGGGIVTHKHSTRTGLVAAALMVPARGADEANPEVSAMALIALFNKGRGEVIGLDDVPNMGRSVQGKLVVQVKSGAQVVALKTVTDAPDLGPVAGATGGPDVASLPIEMPPLNDGDGDDAPTVDAALDGVETHAAATAESVAADDSAELAAQAEAIESEASESEAEPASAVPGNNGRAARNKAFRSKPDSGKASSDKADSDQSAKSRAGNSRGGRRRAGNDQSVQDGTQAEQAHSETAGAGEADNAKPTRRKRAAKTQAKTQSQPGASRKGAGQSAQQSEAQGTQPPAKRPTRARSAVEQTKPVSTGADSPAAHDLEVSSQGKETKAAEEQQAKPKRGRTATKSARQSTAQSAPQSAAQPEIQSETQSGRKPRRKSAATDETPPENASSPPVQASLLEDPPAAPQAVPKSRKARKLATVTTVRAPRRGKQK